jgi:ribonuclease R
VSGLVHITQLPNVYYHFDPARRLLQGERTHAVFRLGDKVRVQVLRASMEDRKIDFRLAGPRKAAAASRAEPVRKPAKRKPGAAKAPATTQRKRRR